LSKVINTGLPY